MELTDNKIWGRLFGSVWQYLTKANSNIGAFAVLHENREVLIDKNAQRLLGFKHTPDYDEICAMLKRVYEYAESGAPIMIHIIETEESVTAGFISLDETKPALSEDVFPLCSQAALVSKMTEDSGNSLLMLIKLVGADENPTQFSFCVYSALSAICGCLSDGAAISEHSKLEYWVYVPCFAGDPCEFAKGLQRSVENCILTDEFGVVISENHVMSFAAGVSMADGSPAERMHSANFALYAACSNSVNGIELYSPEQYSLKKADFGTLRKFTRLLDQNLFVYHFQPIISAQTGEIVAYEALMRTDPSIGLFPLEILDLAQQYGRLYDIEVATIRNTLSFLSENQGYFENRKLFVNSISSQILSAEDYGKVKADFGELMEKVVIELTEQTEITDEKLGYINQRLNENNMQLAIDDYGTGYSNTSNLLRYNPQYVKIDRSLIAGIDSNHKTQIIVSRIIEFLHASGYVALAEGVETFEEMQTMINMSVDLIQGYYVSRPKPVILNEISESLRNEIVRINLEATGQIQKIYRTAADETVNLQQLALEKYSDIFIDGGRVVLEGDRQQPVKISLAVKENSDSEIIFRNVNIDRENPEPALKLEMGSRVKIVCEGENHIGKSGIFVPETSELRISGTGNLTVESELADCYAIGNTSDRAFGNISIDMVGKLIVNASGGQCVGIGGGKNGKIDISGGDINITCSGGNVLAVGCASGLADLNIRECSLRTAFSASSGCCIGSLTGDMRLSSHNIAFECKGAGNKLCAIGSLEGKKADISITHGTVSTVMRGKFVTTIGTYGGNTDCTIDRVRLNLYAEGGVVSGIGDKKGGGAVMLKNSELLITFLTGDGFGVGSPNGKYEFIGGSKSIKINE